MNIKKAVLLVVLSGLLFLPRAYALDRAANVYGAFSRANELYRQADYPAAIKKYLAILKTGEESGNLYYNLGNAYFKSGNIGEAVCYYEKAKKLIPEDSDLKANLQFAFNELNLEPVVPKRFWLVRIFEWAGKRFSLDNITMKTAFCYWLFMLLLICSYAFRQANDIFKRLSKAAAILFVFSLLVFAVRFYDLRICKYGVVIAPETAARFAPAEKAVVYFNLDKGSKVRLLDKNGRWRRIKTPDNKTGWVQAGKLARI